MSRAGENQMSIARYCKQPKKDGEKAQVPSRPKQEGIHPVLTKTSLGRSSNRLIALDSLRPCCFCTIALTASAQYRPAA